MRLITGDECGLLKECIPGLVKQKEQKGTNSFQVKTPIISDQGIRRINNGERSSRRRGVVSLAWTKPDVDQQFASLHVDGTVELWERSVSEHTRAFGAYRRPVASHKMERIFGSDSDGPLSQPLEIRRFDRQEKSLLCACNMQGKVVILDQEREEDFILSSFSVYNNNKGSSREKDRYPLVSAMAVDQVNSRIACGGKDRETVLWDLNTAKQVWKTKNLPPDRQTLLAPQVWPTAIHFMNHENNNNSNSPLLAVGSAHKEVRIYDLRMDAAQRRPVSVTPFGLMEHRVTALCTLDDHRLAAGDAAGFLHTIDLRKLGKKERVRKSIHQVVGTHGRFVGPAGSIQEIVKHDSMPRMGVVSLDRMLRVYDTNTKKEVTCMYLKQRLKCVLVGREKDTDEEIEDTLAHLDDQDIDQEDVVDDYVDSDLETDFQEDEVEEFVAGSNSESQCSDSEEKSGSTESSDDDSDKAEVTHTKKKRKQ